MLADLRIFEGLQAAQHARFGCSEIAHLDNRAKELKHAQDNPLEDAILPEDYNPNNIVAQTKQSPKRLYDTKHMNDDDVPPSTLNESTRR